MGCNPRFFSFTFKAPKSECHLVPLYKREGRYRCNWQLTPKLSDFRVNCPFNLSSSDNALGAGWESKNSSSWDPLPNCPIYLGCMPPTASIITGTFFWQMNMSNWWKWSFDTSHTEAFFFLHTLVLNCAQTNNLKCYAYADPSHFRRKEKTCKN